MRFETSYGALEAALDFLKVPYKSVEVDPLTRSQIKFSKEGSRCSFHLFPMLFSSFFIYLALKDYKKVPIAVFADGKVVGDSTKIVDTVAETEAIELSQKHLAAQGTLSTAGVDAPLLLMCRGRRFVCSARRRTS